MPQDENALFNGWFSQKQKNSRSAEGYNPFGSKINLYGKVAAPALSSIYLSVDGKEVEVTCVSKSNKPPVNTTYFDDLEYKGKFVKFIRSVNGNSHKSSANFAESV